MAYTRSLHRSLATTLLCHLMFLLPLTGPTFGQSQTAAVSTVPRLIKFSGTAKDAQGKAQSGAVGITFALYKDEQGGTPLWLETQSLQADSSGHYTVYLGAASSAGIPEDLFASGDARWLGVQVQGQTEQPRVMLLAVPYALKAADAETIGGLPPSAFVLASPNVSPGGTATAASASTSSSSSATSAPPANPPVTGLGTVNFIPLWDSTSDIVNSALFQTGSGANVKVGINNPTPSTTLDVKGTGTVRGAFSLPATGTATATAGKTSQSLSQVASSFNSGTNAAVNQTFRWQAEPLGNNTTTPSATMNLLFGSGTSQPTETGLKINNKGIFTFADTQTFPGAGTITGVTATGGLIGGGTSGNVTVALTGSCGLGQILQWGSVGWACANVVTNVTPGTDLIETGSLGNITLSVDTTLVPQLNVGNTFTGNQTVNGNLSSTGLVTGSGFQIGSNLFAFGSYLNGNAFLGFSGNTTTTGTSNTGNGGSALFSNTTGSDNTATGGLALTANTTGNLNTASGFEALTSNTTGVSNTADGVFSLAFNTTGGSNTADGSDALYANTTGNLNTAGGVFALSSNTAGNSNTAGGVFALSSNTTGNSNTASGASALGANTTGGNNTASGTLALFSNTTGSNNTALGYSAGPDAAHLNLTNATAIGANAVVNQSNALVLGGTGANAVNVGIGTATPGATLDVHGTGNFTGLITFAPGQSFPGVGTITGVTAGTDLVGGGSSGGVTLSVDTTKVVTGVVAGTDLIGGGTGGLQTLGLDTTKVPQLAAANTFTGNQTVNGNLTATGVATASSYQIGSNLFAYGNYFNQNAFLGFAGNTTMTGPYNTATGAEALASNTTGFDNSSSGFEALFSNTVGSENTASGTAALFSNINGVQNVAEGVFALSLNSSGNGNTASGYVALPNNTTGSSNTAIGFNTLHANSTGSGNTALGSSAGNSADTSFTTGFNNTFLGANTFLSTGSLTNATAVGANAEVSSSNALVLGSIKGVNGATADALVGIGITAPTYKLHVGNFLNSFRVEGPAATGSGGLAASFGGFGDFGIDAPGIVSGRFVVKESGKVGIGTNAPDNTLSVNGSADKVGGGSWGTFSDRRLKTLGGSFSPGLNEVLKIHPIRYRYKEDNGMGITDHEEHIGLVAQEVQKVIPEAVSENSKGYLLVNNDPIIWAMLNAIKQQQQQIKEQRALIQTGLRQIQEQQKQISRLNGKLVSLQSTLRAARGKRSQIEFKETGSEIRRRAQ